MSLEDAFIWLGETPPGLLLAQSTSAFAIVQSIHILAFGLLGGAVLALDLSALRVVFRNALLEQTGRLLLPVFVASLATAAASGLLLVAAGPLKYYTNPLFAWKLGTLVVALLVHLALYPLLTAKFAERGRAIAAALGLASLTLWFGVAILGRWIGLI